MYAGKLLPILTPFLLAFASATSAVAQAPPKPFVDMETTSFNVGLGGSSGDGQLHLPNLGTNCSYPFKVSGFGAGIQVGVSKASASGPVTGLTKISDLAGNYGATEGEMTLIAGGGATSMKNRRNNVQIALQSRTQGLNIGFGGQGMTIALAEPANNAPRAYILEFGFNKTWVNKDSRTTLDQVARAWKCRFVNIWLFGHTDTVGKEDANLELAAQRAAAAREYLLGTGIVPTRVMTVAKGDETLRVPTYQNVRLRTNRAVIVVIQDQSPQQ